MPSKAAHSYFIWLLKETEIFSLYKSQSYILEVPEVMVFTKPTPNVAKARELSHLLEQIYLNSVSLECTLVLTLNS